MVSKIRERREYSGKRRYVRRQDFVAILGSIGEGTSYSMF